MVCPIAEVIEQSHSARRDGHVSLWTEGLWFPIDSWFTIHCKNRQAYLQKNKWGGHSVRVKRRREVDGLKPGWFCQKIPRAFRKESPLNWMEGERLSLYGYYPVPKRHYQPVSSIKSAERGFSPPSKVGFILWEGMWNAVGGKGGFQNILGQERLISNCQLHKGASGNVYTLPSFCSTRSHTCELSRGVDLCDVP